MTKRSMVLVMAGAIALGACADTTTGTSLTADQGGDTSADSTTSGTGPATDLEAITEFQAEIDELSDAISESEAADDLSAAWQSLNAELVASVESIREDGAIAREEIEAGLEDFEQQLDELDVEENVRTAWEELRSHLEQLMTN